MNKMNPPKAMNGATKHHVRCTVCGSMFDRLVGWTTVNGKKRPIWRRKLVCTDPRCEKEHDSRVSSYEHDRRKVVLKEMLDGECYFNYLDDC